MRVLLIDDDPGFLAGLKPVLEAETDIDGRPYQVETESDFDKAEERLATERFEIVIVDVMVAGKARGLEVVESLAKKSPVTIVITSRPGFTQCVQCLRWGAWDYLPKAGEPAEFPDARVDFRRALLESMREGCQSRRKQDMLGEPDPNALWAQENLEMLLDKYAGRVIAILDGRVVADAPSWKGLQRKLRGKFPLIQPFLMIVPDPEEENV